MKPKSFRPALTSLLLAVSLAFPTPGFAAAPPDVTPKTSQKREAANKPAARAMSEQRQAEHVLNRLGYGPRPGEIERVGQMGVSAWIERQLQPEKIDEAAMEARLEPLKALRMSNEELFANYPPLAMVRRIAERVKAGQPVPPRAREVYDRMAGMVPEMTEGGDPEKMRENMTPEQRRYFREHSPQRIIAEMQQAKLLRAVHGERQLHEQMVDFWMNHFNVFAAKGADRWLTVGYERDAIRPRVFGKFRDLLLATARHPAMLFYLDNFQSAAEGSPGGRGLNENYARELMELHTLGVDGGYTEKDVREVARCFTGWTMRRPRGDADYYFNRFMHDNGEKTVLGVRIPAGGGEGDGLKVIDILVNHPSTARFLATKLARRFVSDHPPEALVERVAGVYQRTGGDVREMLRAIFTAPEFVSDDAYRAKVKKPFELAASALRATDARFRFSPPLLQGIARLGEPLYLCEAPTGYPDTADAWISTGAMLNRVNFAGALAANQVPNVRANPERVRVPHLSDNTAALVKQETDPAKVAALLLGSPEFQRR